MKMSVLETVCDAIVKVREANLELFKLTIDMKPEMAAKVREQVQRITDALDGKTSHE